MAQNFPPRQGQGNYGGRNDRDNNPKIDTSEIQLKDIKADLFDRIAQQTAVTIADNKNSNKPSQLRRFYDEIVMWEGKVSQFPEKFDEYLPFIRMINAKAAYALGRKLVDDNFVTLINVSLKQVNDVSTMRHFKLFMEAFMGFYKEKRPKD